MPNNWAAGLGSSLCAKARKPNSWIISMALNAALRTFRADHHESDERDYCQHFLFSVHRTPI
jgi:hypothetical protein